MRIYSTIASVGYWTQGCFVRINVSEICRECRGIWKQALQKKSHPLIMILLIGVKINSNN